jgi:hypothetical protein
MAFPSEQQLQTASGRLSGNAALSIAITSACRAKSACSCCTAEQKLQAAADAVAYPARVSFDPQQRGGAMLLSGQFYPVYGVSVGGKPVLPLETVRGYYRHDNLVALGLGLLFLLAGGWRSYQCATAIKRYPLDQLD